MIRSYCSDTEKAWDEGIHLLLFAVRESVQESLGLSPFESLLATLFVKRRQEDTPLNLLKKVSGFLSKLLKACQAAN